MTKTEIAVIQKTISRLRAGRDGAPVRASDEIAAALLDPQMRIFLDSWVIGPLELLLPGQERNLNLAKKIAG